MREASKTNRVRGPGFAERYFQGQVLDIGAGPDPVCPGAKPFDREHGDANFIDRYFPAGSFDCVHSSHCLEHMADPADALSRWWSLVRPGGHMVLVVPDEDLYEQGTWPSFFNDDHKSSFRLGTPGLGLPRSYDILALCRGLPGAQVVSATLQDAGYDRALRLPQGMAPRRLRHPLKFSWSVVRRVSGPGGSLRRAFQGHMVRTGHPVDQTAEDALAQFELVLRKAG